MQPTFWDTDSFNFMCCGRQLAPNRYNLGGGLVWDVVMQPSPEVLILKLALDCHALMQLNLGCLEAYSRQLSHLCSLDFTMTLFSATYAVKKTHNTKL